MVDAKAQGVQRGGAGAGGVKTGEFDQNANYLTAFGAGMYTDMARAGGVWNVIGAATAPVAAIPTTAAITEIYNNPTSGMVMEVIDVFLFNLLGTAIVHCPSIWAMVTAPKAAPSTGSLVINSQSGRGKYTDTATTRVTTGSATTVVANGWRPFSAPYSPSTMTATVGTAYSAPVNGQLLVPPGCSLCLSATDVTASGTVQLGATWNERVFTVVA